LAEFLKSDPKNKVVASRVERKYPTIICQEKPAFPKLDMKLAAFKNSAVLIAKDWKQDFIPKLLLQRVPVDVEE
jgi:hypothetical protein